MELNATIVNCTEDENNIIIVGFSNNQDFVILQYSTEFDEQDLANGWSKYYLEISSFGGSYSCIDMIELHSDSLNIKLNKNGIKKFTTNIINIKFFLLQARWNELEIFLVKIFENDKSVNFKVIKS